MNSNAPNLIDTAIRCLKAGFYVFPLGEKSKLPDGSLAPHGFKSASNDESQIKDWWTKSPNANIGIDLGRSNLTVLDFDNGAPPAGLLPEGSFQVTTGRGTHVYFVGIAKQADMYWNSRHIGEIKSDGGYVLSPFSIHPSGVPYSIKNGSTNITPLPEGLLDQLRASALTKCAASNEADNGANIPHGQHDTRLTAIAGKFHREGLRDEGLADALIKVCEERCEGYGTDYREMCEKIAKSVSRYPVTPSKDITLNQKPSVIVCEPEIEDCEIIPRPVFPRDVMEETSTYTNLVQPAVEHSSKYPELIFIPAMQAYLNYTATKVNLGHLLAAVPNMFVGIIAPYGQYFKSSSCELAHTYFRQMGLLSNHSRDITNAEGRTLVSSVGSTEGFGLMMQNSNCRNAILYYDELGKFISKAAIENSSFGDDLLTMYESGLFSNHTKDSKKGFSFEQKSYCFSWLWCTTDRAFVRHWEKLDNISTGLNDRMFFLLAPEKPKEATLYREDFHFDTTKTRRLIDQAVQKGSFDYLDFKAANQKLSELKNPRAINAAQNYALFFAMDLGRASIDDDCINRAYALAKYRQDVLAYLDPIEGETLQGKKQLTIIRELRRNAGKMPYRSLKHELGGEKWGTGMWDSCFNGLVNSGRIAVREAIKGYGPDQRPKMVYLIKQVD